MNNTLPEGYTLSSDKTLLQFDRIHAMLQESYWAGDRPQKTVRKSAEHSICFAVYCDGVQVGFARAMTDYATTYYICDVMVDTAHRGKGLGKALIGAIVEDEVLKPLKGILMTKDAHGLYEKFGFVKLDGLFMFKR